MIQEFYGTVVSPKGFQAIGVAAGVKKGKYDLALLVSDVPAEVAACFTTNVVKAASVLRNQALLKAGKKIRAVAVNSGNANACTGLEGKKANEEMARTLAEAIGAQTDEVWTASTGVIGVPFPIDTIKKGIEAAVPALGNRVEKGRLAARAIMTTDTYPKEVAVRFEIDGKKVTMAGMAKGSGMIHPNMATMLGFITTDCAISQELLQKALSADVQQTYNMVSVDGDTSTNDTVLVMANGLADNPKIETEGPSYDLFRRALHYVNEFLAKNLVKDGEGATKFIEVTVTGAKTQQDAKVLAKSVACSNLLKAAIFGEDANWDRVLCALGYSGVSFDPERVDIRFESKAGKIMLMDCGAPIVFDEEKAAKILAEREIHIVITLREGDQSATAWGCDLSYEYVRINGDYRS